MRRWVLRVALVVLLAVLVGWAGDVRFGSGSDAGGKLATASVMADGFTCDPDVGWWAASLDPDARLHQLVYTDAHGSQYVQATSLGYQCAVMPLYRVFGPWGPVSLSILGCIAAALAAARIVWRIGKGGLATGQIAAFWLVGLAGPAFFYALDVWEHAPALGLLAWAVALALGPPTGRRALAIGVLGALAVALRAESAVYLVALVGAALTVPEVRRRWLARSAACVVGVLGAGFVTGAHLWLERALVQASVRGDRGAELAGQAGGDLAQRLTTGVVTTVGVFASDQAAALLIGGALCAALVAFARRAAATPSPAEALLAAAGQSGVGPTQAQGSLAVAGFDPIVGAAPAGRRSWRPGVARRTSAGPTSAQAFLAVAGFDPAAGVRPAARRSGAGSTSAQGFPAVAGFDPGAGVGLAARPSTPGAGADSPAVPPGRRSWRTGVARRTSTRRTYEQRFLTVAGVDPAAKAAVAARPSSPVASGSPVVPAGRRSLRAGAHRTSAGPTSAQAVLAVAGFDPGAGVVSAESRFESAAPDANGAADDRELVLASHPAAAVGGLGLLARLAGGLGFVPGLLPAAPMAAVGLFTGRRSPEHRWLVRTAVAAVPAVILLQWSGNLVAQWGSRYLLATGLLLTALGCSVIGRHQRSTAMLVAVSVVIGGMGVAWRIDRSNAVADTVHAVQAGPADEIILSTQVNLAREAGGVYGERRWLVAETRSELADADAILAAEAPSAIVVVTGGAPLELQATTAAAGYTHTATDHVDYLGTALRVDRYERTFPQGATGTG